MEITLNDLRSLHTALAFAVFVGITVWAWSGKRKAAFDEAARLPLDEEEECKNERTGG